MSTRTNIVPTERHASRKRDTTLEVKTDRGLEKVMDAIEKLMEPDAHRPTLGFARKKVR